MSECSISKFSYLSTEGKGGGETGTVTESTRGNERDLEGLSSQGQQDQSSNIILTGVTSALSFVPTKKNMGLLVILRSSYSHREGVSNSCAWICLLS